MGILGYGKTPATFDSPFYHPFMGCTYRIAFPRFATLKLKSMKITITFIFGTFWALLFAFPALAQPTIEWQKRYGGTSGDWADHLIQNPDGSHLLVGSTMSNDGNVSGNKGMTDGWVVKIDAQGDIIWKKCYGGSSLDGLTNGIRLPDGGYVLVGSSLSNNGDVTGNRGGGDAWVIRIDSVGTRVWTKCFGGSGYDRAESIIQTLDGGFLVTAYTNSTNGDGIGNHGEQDALILKLATNGTPQWKKVLGGISFDGLGFPVQNADSSYTVAGYKNALNFAWVVGLSKTGDQLWENNFGGTGGNEIGAIIKDSTGGYFLGGTVRYNSNLPGFHGGADYWVVKIDEDREVVWQKCYGGNDEDEFKTMKLLPNGSLLLMGTTKSIDGDLAGLNGAAWIVNINALGEIVWSQTMGVSTVNNDRLFAATIHPTLGFVMLAGALSSNASNLPPPLGPSEGDFWLVKLASFTTANHPSVIPSFASVYPNPVDRVLHIDSPEPVQVELTDLMGRALLNLTTSAFSSHSKSMDIEVSHLPTGLYHLVVHKALGEVQIVKFTKN